MEELRLSIIQTELHWENPSANRQMFEKLFDSIQGQTDIIVLPEMFTTGFTMNASSNSETVNGKTVEWIKVWAKKKNCVITGSFIVQDSGKYFNRLIWMKPGGDYETYNKRHLFRLSGEEKIYSAGNKKRITNLNGWKICPLVCYDLRFPIWSRRTPFEDYDVLIYIANWPERRINAWKQLLPARAIENQAYVVGVNRIGKDGNDVKHTGESVVINFKGEKINRSESDKEFVETIRLSYSALESFRNSHPFHLDADSFELRS